MGKKTISVKLCKELKVVRASDLFKIGDRASWTYRHYLNHKSSTLITKRGTILRFTKNRTIAVIKFDKNKYPSRVLLDELGF